MQPKMESPLNRSQSLASGLEKTSPTWKPPHSHSSSTLSSPHSRQVRVSTQNRWEFRGALIQDRFPTSASQRLGSDRRPAGRDPGRWGESSGHECSWNLWGIPPQEEEVATERMAQGENPPPPPPSHSPTPFLWLMSSGHCLPFFSDTLSWKLGSCATPRVSTMSVNLPFHRRNSHFLLNKKNMYRIQVLRGRVQGSLDVSHAVMAVNKKSYRIDLDAGDILYHMKVKVYRLIFKQFPASKNVV